jgi:hypothetical protein
MGEVYAGRRGEEGCQGTTFRLHRNPAAAQPAPYPARAVG